MQEIDKKLYSLFSDKTLSFGCMINWKDDETDDFQFIINYPNDNEDFKVSFDGNYTRYPSLDDFEILGHEPQLHDVFRLAKEKGFYYYDMCHAVEGHYIGFSISPNSNDIEIPYNPTLPLLAQEESTKEQLISLFS